MTYTGTTGTSNIASGHGGLVLGSPSTISTAGVAVSIGAVLSGISLTKSGVGTLTLSGTNGYTGATTISAGVLNIRNASALGSTAGATSVTSGAALQIEGTFSIGAEGLTLNGTGVAADGALRNISGTSTYAGAITLGSSTRINSDSGTLTLNVASGNAISGTYNLTIGGAGSVTVADPIATSTGTLTKDGAGTLTLSGTNTYSGSTTVNVGTLTLNYATNTSKLSDTTALILGGGTVNMTGGSHTEVVGSTTLNAGASAITRAATGSTAVLQLNAITHNVGGTINFGAASIATTDTSNSNGILGPWATINGSDWAVSAASASDTAITAYTGYTDVTRLSSGTKVIANNSANNVRIIDGTTAPANSITLAGATTTINTLKQSATGGIATIDPAGQTLAVKGILVATGASGLNVGSGTNNGTLMSATSGGELILDNYSTNALTINSVIANNTNPSALTKSGAGTVTLNSANTYSGNTLVNQGTLTLTASGSIANSPVIGVGSGATLNVSAVSGWTVGSSSSHPQTLTGAGGVTGATTIGTYGTHNAGDGGVGAQAFSSTLTYANSSIFEWDLNANSTSGGFDTVSAVSNISVGTTGTVFKVIFGSGVDWSNAFWSTPYITQTWSMDSIFGKAFSSGAFQSVQTSIDVSSYGSFSISGTALTFTAVPEPTSALAGLLLGAGLLRRRR